MHAALAYCCTRPDATKPLGSSLCRFSRTLRAASSLQKKKKTQRDRSLSRWICRAKSCLRRSNSCTGLSSCVCRFQVLSCVCPQTTVCLSSYYCMCFVILLYVCRHTTVDVSSYYCRCVLILLYVSSYYCRCVLILL